MRLIKASSSGSAHELAVKMVMKYGDPITTEEGEETKECDEICIEINEPLSEPRISKKSGFGPMACNEYAHQLIYGGKGGFDYDYHERLFEYPDESEFKTPINQIQYIIEKLRKNITSRRAVAITWRPDEDRTAPSVPCLQLVQCIIRFGQPYSPHPDEAYLDMKVVFRSNDMLSALGPNMYGLIELQKYIAEKLKVRVGNYTHISLVPHIYHKRDASQLEVMMETTYEESS